MLNRLMISVCGVCLVLLTSCSDSLSQSKVDKIEKAILDVHAKLVKAAENLDADAMFEYILDSDETTIQTGDVVQNRNDALESVRESFARFSKIQYDFDLVEVTVLTPTTAEMNVKGKSVDTTTNGRVLTFHFRQKNLYVLTDDGWKLKHAQHMPE